MFHWWWHAIYMLLLSLCRCPESPLGNDSLKWRVGVLLRCFRAGPTNPWLCRKERSWEFRSSVHDGSIGKWWLFEVVSTFGDTFARIFTIRKQVNFLDQNFPIPTSKHRIESSVEVGGQRSKEIDTIDLITCKELGELEIRPSWPKLFVESARPISQDTNVHIVNSHSRFQVSFKTKILKLTSPAVQSNALKPTSSLTNPIQKLPRPLKHPLQPPTPNYLPPRLSL